MAPPKGEALLPERKVREYTKLESVQWTELLLSKGELKSLLPYLTVKYIQYEPYLKEFRVTIPLKKTNIITRASDVHNHFW